MTTENRQEAVKDLANVVLEERLKQVNNMDQVFTTLSGYHATFGIRQQIDEAYTFHTSETSCAETTYFSMSEMHNRL